jgi:hypothetical protein
MSPREPSSSSMGRTVADRTGFGAIPSGSVHQLVPGRPGRCRAVAGEDPRLVGPVHPDRRPVDGPVGALELRFDQVGSHPAGSSQPEVLQVPLVLGGVGEGESVRGDPVQ